MKQKKMNKKHKRFCEEYIVDFNATQAAIRVGYSEKTSYSIGQRLLKNVEVKRYIDELMENLKKKSIAEADEVMKYLTSVMRGEKKEQTLILIGEGVQNITEIEVSAKERLKAAELLGKRYGLFTDAVKLDGIPCIIFSGEGDLTDE